MSDVRPEARDRRAERAAARQKRDRRGAGIAAVSTIVVLTVLVALIVTNPGWPDVREKFFNWDIFKEYFPDIARAFWLDVRVFMIVEVVVLVLGLVVALGRLSKGPAMFPLRSLALIYSNLFRGVPVVLVLSLIHI